MLREEAFAGASIEAWRQPEIAPQPVFVLGSMRSGASLLALSLAQHSKTVTIQDSTWLERFALGLEQTLIDAASASSVPHAQPLDRSAFLQGFGDTVSRMLVGERRATRWLDSSYTHSFIAVPLARIFPRGRFIHVVRDVDGVVASLTSAENRRSYRSQHRQLSLQDAYEHWMDVVTACIEAERCLGSDVVLRVRRKDLLLDPEGTLRRCFDFIGESYESVCLRTFSGFDDTPLRAPEVDYSIDEPWRTQVDIFSRTLLDEATPSYAPDDAWRARLEGAFLRRSAAGIGFAESPK
jgi:hypothetical protein